MLPQVITELDSPGAVSSALNDAMSRDDAVVVTDEYVAESAMRGDLRRLVARRSSRGSLIVLPEAGRGTLDWALDIVRALRSTQAKTCTAIGGGSVLDSAKTAVASLEQPWLLDPAIWQSSSGRLPMVRERKRGKAGLTLVAVPTLPGSAAQVAPRATLAHIRGQSQKMAFGSGLVPDFAVVDSELWSDVERSYVLVGLSEMLFRTLGPYLVTKIYSSDQEVDTLRIAHCIVDIGVQILRSQTSIDAPLRANIDRLSMESARPERVRGWSPGIHPWWCVQNSLAAATAMPKRSLTPRGFLAVLDGVPPASCARLTASQEKIPERNQGRSLIDDARYFLGEVSRSVGDVATTVDACMVDRAIVESLELWGPSMKAAGWGDQEAIGEFVRAALWRR
ncbi:iron-containing alcohol dehydrogenase [Brachybacterium paraconglomeratum]